MMKLGKNINKLIIHCIKTINFFKRMKGKEKIKRVFHKITIPQCIKKIWQWIKDFFTERPFEGVAIVFFVVIFISLIVRIIGDESHWLDSRLGTDGESNAKYQTLKSLALGLAGLVGLLGLFISNRRAKTMEKQAEEQAKSVDAQAKSANAQAKSADAQTKSVEEQVKANENKTFNEATGHLGHSSSSVRLVGIYILYDLALSKRKKRLKNIIEILSAHVRATTQEEEYQKKYKKKPSDEISSLLKLLSNLNIKYLSENEEEKWYPLDLSNAYLCGLMLSALDFRKANLTRSNFANAKLEGSFFEGAFFQESLFEGAFFLKSNFKNAYLIRSNFKSAFFQESNFKGADLILSDFKSADFGKSHFEDAKMKISRFEGAKLEESHFAGAIFGGSHFAGADLCKSHFAGADLCKSHFEGADLRESHFERSDLRRSHFEGADLRESHFEGANLKGSHFEGANLKGSHFESAILLGTSNFKDGSFYKSCFGDEDTNLEGPHFEGANLKGSLFEGAFLGGAHFAGADLVGSNFACAAFYESHFACADLSGSHFEGASDNALYNSDVDAIHNSIDRFKERILRRRGKKAEIEDNVFFAGGITEEYIIDLEEIIENTLLHFTLDKMKEEFNQRMNLAIEALKKHKDQSTNPPGIPEHLKGSIFLGELTKEKADEIIQRYKEAMKKYNKIKKKI